MEITPKPSYMPEAIRYGAIFAVIYVGSTFVYIYNSIATPPTGSPVSMSMVFPVIGCLIAAFGGLLVVRSFAKETGRTMKAGQGAVMGLVTGLIMAGIATVIGQIWTQIIDPTLMDRFTEAAIANFEIMKNVSESQRNDGIDRAFASNQEAKTVLGIVKSALYGLGILGVLNLITGIIGVSIFAKKEEVL